MGPANYCTKCGDRIFVVAAGRTYWKGRCAGCGRRYELNDELEVVEYYPPTWWLVAGFLILVLAAAWAAAL